MRYFLKISCSFGHDVAVHVVWIAAQEIVHQLAEGVVPMILTVDIENMFPIVEWLAGDQIYPLDGIDARSAAME